MPKISVGDRDRTSINGVECCSDRAFSLLNRQPYWAIDRIKTAILSNSCILPHRNSVFLLMVNTSISLQDRYDYSYPLDRLVIL
ncbi:MAG: hypothetical protein KME17_21410 [Cyanosarcina radialis HA8281-LM2]|nr:hypothetical protein [Cyanosarcina radialis HA8281-LM2]